MPFVSRERLLSIEKVLLVYLLYLCVLCGC